MSALATIQNVLSYLGTPISNIAGGTMYRKTNKAFAICMLNFATHVTCDVLARLLVSELVWYLMNEVCKVRKLRQSINYIHKASIIFMKLTGTIQKYQLKMNHTG